MKVNNVNNSVSIYNQSFGYNLLKSPFNYVELNKGLVSNDIFDFTKSDTTNNKINLSSKKNNLKTFSKVIAFAAIATGIAFGISKLRNGSKTISNSLFDENYKKSLLNALGFNDADTTRLRSVAGKDEFLGFLQGFQHKPEVFSVGTDFINAKNLDFAGNMHIHTVNSDGQMTVKDLLDQSVGYANKYFKKNNKPFFIAITDHNTVKSDIEALKIISSNPEKYKNLRVVLGTELNAVCDDNQAHILAYAINPFSSGFAKLTDNQIAIMQKNIKQSLCNANEKFSDILSKYNFSFSFDDMAKIRSSVKTSPVNINYSMKDYLQFRLIYADLVENNPELINFLKKNNISLSELDFSIPKYNISSVNPKQPYWLNYVDELKKYVKSFIKEKSGDNSANESEHYFKNISSDINSVLNELESATLNPQSNLHTNGVKFESIDTLLDIFEQEQDTVIGFAHPCLLYGRNGVLNIKDDKTKNVINSIFEKISNRAGIKNKISESYYQCYYKKEGIDDITDYAKKLAEKFNFIHSGSYDSHQNSIFTNNNYLPVAILKDLTI